jgi:ribonuclease Z
MLRLTILGTARIPDRDHENAHMALVSDNGTVLIDCVGTPIVRLEKAGIPFTSVEDLILTHFHPDHVSGVPGLLMNMWLIGRQKPLRIYGLHHTLERLEDLMAFYHWDNWPGFFQVSFHRLPEREKVAVIERDGFRVVASPVRHYVPTLGLRFERTDGSRAVAYSCDTEPCQSVINLASGADLLIHEASGAGVGHSSASQAGEVARQAEVGRLLLIHYPTRDLDPRTLVAEARTTFPGEVGLALDFMELEL